LIQENEYLLYSLALCHYSVIGWSAICLFVAAVQLFDRASS
jgi:hypothetical protein